MTRKALASTPSTRNNAPVEREKDTATVVNSTVAILPPVVREAPVAVASPASARTDTPTQAAARLNAASNGAKSAQVATPVAPVAPSVPSASTHAERLLALMERTVRTQESIAHTLAELVRLQSGQISVTAPVAPSTAIMPAPVASAPAPAPVAPKAPKPAPAPAPASGKAQAAYAKLVELRSRLVAPSKIACLDAILAGVKAGTVTDAHIASDNVQVDGVSPEVLANVTSKIRRIAGIKPA